MGEGYSRYFFGTLVYATQSSYKLLFRFASLHQDEIVSPNCVAFNLDGSEIYCGFNNMVRVFKTARPGRECQNRPTLGEQLVSISELSRTFKELEALNSRTFKDF